MFMYLEMCSVQWRQYTGGLRQLPVLYLLTAVHSGNDTGQGTKVMYLCIVFVFVLTA